MTTDSYGNPTDVLSVDRPAEGVARDNLKAIKSNFIAALELAPEGQLGW